MSHDPSLNIPPAIGIAIEEKLTEADRLRADADALERFAQDMIIEYAVAAGALAHPEQQFTYSRTMRTVSPKPLPAAEPPQS